MDKLKPCPFCGNKVRLSIEDYDVDGKMVKFIYIACKNANCLISPDTGFCKTEQEAIEAWNTRPTTYLDNIAFEPNLSDKCKAVRKVFGETQKEFGERLGIPQSTVTYLEKATDSFHCRESVRGAIEQINKLYDRFVGEENG